MPAPSPLEPPPPAKMESLDPEEPAPAPASGIEVPHTPTPSSGEHPMWSADPFTPTGESAELAEPEPAPKGDFAGLSDEAHAQHEKTLEEPRPPMASPSAEAEEPPYPGDEPTRVEPVSAALLDKLRERDEGEAPATAPQEAAPPMDQTIQGWGSVVSGEQAVTPEADPDEEHWRETFEKFREMKSRLGEPLDKINFEKFAAKLRKNREDLIVKHNAKGVRFAVYEKEGKASIKATALR
jgi:hypothetical protein